MTFTGMVIPIRPDISLDVCLVCITRLQAELRLISLRATKVLVFLHMHMLIRLCVAYICKRRISDDTTKMSFSCKGPIVRRGSFQHAGYGRFDICQPFKMYVSLSAMTPVSIKSTSLTSRKIAD